MAVLTGVATTSCSVLSSVPLFFPVVNSPRPSLSFCTNVFKLSYNTEIGRFALVLLRKCSKLNTFVVKSNKKQSLYNGVWEDPDDGSGSDFDEEMEEDVNYKSDWEEEESDATRTTSSVVKASSGKYEEDLVKEVEQLLGPEERAILEQNATPNLSKISTAKWKPLQTFALAGQIGSIDKLLEGGLDIDSVDKHGFTALHKAIIGKRETVISHLLRKGASPHTRDRDGASLLHYAVQVGAMQTVRLLIKYKVDVNVADNEGWTPLHIAMQSRNRDIAKVLLVNGADKNRRNKDGRTPLDLAICYGRDFKSYDLAKLLKLLLVGNAFKLAGQAVAAAKDNSFALKAIKHA